MIDSCLGNKWRVRKRRCCVRRREPLSRHGDTLFLSGPFRVEKTDVSKEKSGPVKLRKVI